MLTTIIVFVLVLSLLVFVHEFGHFFSARRLGVKVEEFGFGFPPRIFAYYKNTAGKWKRVWGNKKIEDQADTLYSINSILVGGFVKIKGEDGENKDNSDSFSAKKIWQRAVILSSGVIMNIVLAAVLISIGLMIGFPQAIDREDLPARAIISHSQVQIIEILADSPASGAGLLPSDVILGIEGREVEKSDDVSEIINQSSADTLLFSLNRSGQSLELMVKPEKASDSDRRMIGIALAETATVRYPWYLAIGEGFKMTGELLVAIVVAFYDLIKNLIVGGGAQVEVAGPIGIANLTGQMFRLGLIYLIQFMALLSLNLAVINILPFPALDGGRLLFLLFEKIKGRPLKPEIEAVFNNIGFMLLMVLIVWVTFKDIIKLFN